MQVRFTDHARRQLDAHLAYIHADRPTAAVALRKRMMASLRRLEEFPYSGRVVPEFPDQPYREIIVAPYRFMYRVDPDVVHIVSVRHGAQIADQPSE